MWFMDPIMLFFVIFGNKNFGEAESYQKTPFKVHIAVKETRWIRPH